MKKIINCILVVFLMFAFISIPNVYANDCSTYGVSSCESHTYKTSNGTEKKCAVKAVNSKGVSVSPCCTTQDGICGGEGELPDFLEEDDTTSCGRIKNIPKYIPFISSLTVTVLTIISMGMLVIMGTIDLFKGTVSGKDDEIKKNQKAFIGRLTSAIIIFLLVALTKILVGLIGSAMGTTNGIASCIDLFINNR